MLVQMSKNLYKYIMGQHPQLPSCEAQTGLQAEPTLPNLERLATLAPLPLGEDFHIHDLEETQDTLLQAAATAPDPQARIDYEIAAIGTGFEIGMHKDTPPSTAGVYFAEGAERLSEIQADGKLPLALKIRAGLLHANTPLLGSRRSLRGPSDDEYDLHVRQLALCTQWAVSGRSDEACSRYSMVAGTSLLAALGASDILESLPFMATARENCSIPGVAHARAHLAHDYYFINNEGKMPVRVDSPLAGVASVTGSAKRVAIVNFDEIVARHMTAREQNRIDSLESNALTLRVISWAVAMTDGMPIRDSRREIVHDVADSILRQVVETFPRYGT